ncbi:hypothetical protein LJC46_07025, partial [Desulfovibrio sp. OttesenSCG-928-G15]|nr:hypothetical protein [Desulfovibrio sp. OttesenSCG-928-G15]
FFEEGYGLPAHHEGIAISFQEPLRLNIQEGAGLNVRVQPPLVKTACLARRKNSAFPRLSPVLGGEEKGCFASFFWGGGGANVCFLCAFCVLFVPALVMMAGDLIFLVYPFFSCIFSIHGGGNGTGT